MARSRIIDLERQLQQVQAQAERTRRLLEVLQRLSLASRGSTTFRQIFDAIAGEMHHVFRFDAFYIAVCDPTEPNTFRAVLLLDEGEADYRENMPFGALTGMIVGERHPLLFEDLVRQRSELATAPDSFGHVEKLSRAWLGVPLLVGANAIGVLSLQSYEPNRYNTADVELLQRIGDVVAVILENTWLDEQQRALGEALADQVAARTVELATMNAITAELVVQQPLPVLLGRALNLIVPLFGMDAGTVRLLDSQHDMLNLLAQRGFSPAYEQDGGTIPVSGTAPGIIVRENRPLVIERGLRLDALEHLSPYLPYTSLLGVPLRSGMLVIGALSLFGREPHAFSQQLIELAQAIGNQIAIAVENARLFEAQERQIGELRALGSISRAASTTLDLPTLLRLVHDELRQFVPLDAFSMIVYDPTRGVVTDGISIDEGREYISLNSYPPPADSLTAWIFRQRRSLLFRNLPEEVAQFPDIRRHQFGSERAAVSWLGVPMLNREGAVIGAIFVQGYQPGVFDERDEAFLESVAGQVALHVQNARLLTQRDRQIRELDGIGQIGQIVSASYEFDAILHGVYQTINELLQPSVFYLLICEPETLIVSHAIFIEDGQQVPLAWVGEPPKPGSITAWIMNQREPLLFRDLVAQRDELQIRGIRPRSIGPENPVRSWVGVPLLAKDSEPIGVLALQDYESYRYDDQTIDLLSQIASHISLGIQKVRLFEERERQIAENARLYAAEQEARRTADTLREVARVLSASVDPREVLELMLRELNNVIAYDSASIMLLDRDVLRIAAARGFDTRLITREISMVTERSAAALVVRNRQPQLLGDIGASEDWMQTPISRTAINSWLGVPLIAKGEVLGVLNIDSRQFNYFSARDVAVAQAFANQAAVALENARLYEESVTRVEQELEIARRIQSNLFPHALPQVAGLSIAARCIPARETGGDFFDFVLLEEVNELALFVGDASGKSIPGAMLMAIAHSIVRSEARDHRTPELVIRETNSCIAEDVPKNSFVALCYATLSPDLRLALANAGQLTPLRRRANGAVDYLEVPGLRLPLGILANTPYEALEVQLYPGDTLVLFTDGIVEAQNAAHELFGFERLEALLRDHDGSPTTLVDAVLSAIDRFTDGTPPHDDMTIVALKVKSEE